MTRIIGGVAGGRRLRTPPGDRTRPTSDRVREALFSSLESMLGTLRGLAVLDLYAGSGAVGLEAASRGADRVLLVESHPPTARLIRDNARALGLDVEVRAAHAAAALGGPPPVPFDVVFADPPYDLAAQLETDLATLALVGWVAEGGLVVVERSARSVEPSWPPGWEALRSKRYGETVLWYVRASREMGPQSGQVREGES